MPHETLASDLSAQFQAGFARRGEVEKYALGDTRAVSEGEGKIQQVKANYKPAFGAARCENCAHFRAASHACELVAGRIEPYDVCDLFMPERPDLTRQASERYAKEAEKFSQPSDEISPQKAREMLADGTAHGHPLTDAQKRMLGAAVGRGEGK